MEMNYIIPVTLLILKPSISLPLFLLYLQLNLSVIHFSDLNIVLRYDFNDAFPFARRDDGVVVMIHPPGTPPLFDRRKLHPLYPGRWMYIGVTQVG